MNQPRRSPTLGAACLTLLLLTAPVRPLAGEPGPAGSPPRRLRQPVALAFVDGGKTLIVANRRSGSLSVVDVPARRVVAEHDVGRGLADLVALPDGRHLLAADQSSHELLVINYHDRSIRVIDRVKVSPD